MTKVEFLRRLDEAMELEPGTLMGDESLDSLDTWDSLATLNYIAMVDEQFGMNLSGQQVAQCSTVNDLVGLVGDKVSG